jgi:uncharacterized protein DUF6448
MRKTLMASVLLAGLIAFPLAAEAHCDSVDGPVASAAVKALESENVNLILPYAPASAEAELTEAFRQTLAVRPAGGEAKLLADRYFMETAVRLHRAGEHAPYTGLKPAGTDFGPAIPAAERALESGQLTPVLSVLDEVVTQGAEAKLAHAARLQGARKAPTSHAEVGAARERVSAELDFISYIEGIYLAAKGGGHAEGNSQESAHGE